MTDVEDIYYRALELPEGPERDAWLDEACAGDVARRAEVDSLLEADAVARGAGFLDLDATDGSDGPPTARLGRDRYKVLSLLGEGAQATVHLAQDEELGRRVALKVLRTSVADRSVAALQRFRREATATARLEHPAICRIYDAGHDDGVAWIAMQYVPGETLAARLDRRDDLSTSLLPPRTDTGQANSGLDEASVAPRPTATRSTESGHGAVDRILAFFEDAARALHAAHLHGLVHRDVKPGNLMVCDDGRPVVLDFGIAHVTEGSEDDVALTRTMDVLGTPHYLAPEHLEAGTDPQRIDGRVDVYALGVTLYECLTGRRPFEAASRDALYRAILGGDVPSLRSLTPRLGRDLDVVVATAMQRDRGLRYADALAFAEDLRRVRAGEPILARPVSVLGRIARWGRRDPALATSLAGILLIVSVGLVVTTILLQQTRAALVERDEAAASRYDDLSEHAAAADVRGEDAGWQVSLEGLATEVLDAAIPSPAGAPSASARILTAWQNVRRAAMQDQERAAAYVDVVRAVRESTQDPLARLALNDLVHKSARDLLLILAFDADAKLGNRRAAAELGRLAVEDSAALSVDDPRRIRARMLLVDSLNRIGRSSESAELLEEWLAAEPNDNSLRVALYESRLGHALLAEGAIDAARPLLERSVHVIREYMPRTWYSNLGLGRYLEVDALFDISADAQAERRRLRAQLRSDLVQSPLLAVFVHSSAEMVRASLDPEMVPLWDRLKAFYRRALLAVPELGEVETCMRDLEADLESLDLEPGNPFFGMIAGNFASSGGRFPHVPDPAITLQLERAVELAGLAGPMHHVNASAPLWMLGVHRIALGDHERAEAVLRRASDLCPVGSRRRTDIAMPLAEAALHRGKYADAERRIGFAMKAARGSDRGKWARGHRLLAMIGRLRGDLDGALEAYDALGGERGAPVDRRARAWTLLMFGEPERARQAYAELERAGEPIGRYLARLELVSGDVAGAIETARAGVESDPAAHRVLAQALLHEAVRRPSADGAAPGTDWQGVIAQFERGAEATSWLNGDGFPSDHCIALAAAGRVADARARLERLAERRPRDPEAWFERARFLTRADGLNDQDRQAAIRCAETAIELCNDGRPHITAMLAEACFAAGDARRAADVARDLLERMAGRNARWLPVADVESALERYEAR